MKISVSNECYNEISVALKRIGRDINDGTVISLEKGDAIIPPQDFRMVAIRQNCLMSASEVFKSSAKDTPEEFLDISNKIFNWCLNGEAIEKQPEPAKEWK